MHIHTVVHSAEEDVVECLNDILAMAETPVIGIPVFHEAVRTKQLHNYRPVDVQQLIN